jgi:coenzyme F420 hydrogenase subunit beta
VACPFGLLEYAADSFGPRRSDGLPIGECSRGDKTCGICARACPRFGDAGADADRFIHGRVHTSDEPYGVVRKIVVARVVSQPGAATMGQDGGVVSALLIWGLQTGQIDCALTASPDGDRPLEGRPTIVTDEAGVRASAGSRYTYCPTPLSLKEAVAQGMQRIALVGTGCQASIPAVMGAHGLAKWHKRVAWTFGLLCSKTFTYEGLVEGRIAGELGIPLDTVTRVDIKGKITVEHTGGDVQAIPLKEAGAWTRRGCRECPDFAAEHADLSFGGLGQKDRWTMVLIRTERGERIWNEACAAGIVELRDVEPATLTQLSTMAQAQRDRKAKAQQAAADAATKLEVQ